MDKIIIINKSPLEIVPPTITLAKLLKDQKKDIKIICTTCSLEVRKTLEKKGINVYETKHKVLLKGKLGKLEDWFKFKEAAWNMIDKEYDSKTKLWVATGDTVLALGRKIYKYKYNLTLLELYDKNYIYKAMLGSYAKKARNLIVPEFCRANIMRVWWKLPKMPKVLENKPYANDLLKIENIKNIEGTEGKKIILYQGHINKDRDLTNIVKALKLIGSDEYILVLMGTNHNKTVEYLKKIYIDIVHIGYIEAPKHLEITKKAFIGIATYDDSSLNQVFCAPNKIYEYTGFGVPVLARKIPGLEYTIGASNSGICVNMDNIQEIGKAIKRIDSNYLEYRNSAYKFYENVEQESVILEILEEI